MQPTFAPVQCGVGENAGGREGRRLHQKHSDTRRDQGKYTRGPALQNRCSSVRLVAPAAAAAAPAAALPPSPAAPPAAAAALPAMVVAAVLLVALLAATACAVGVDWQG